MITSTEDRSSMRDRMDLLKISLDYISDGEGVDFHDHSDLDG